jgi:hypothetical protein
MRTSRYPEFSFTKGDPLLQPGPAWTRPACTPMARIWRRRVADKFWSTKFKGNLVDCIPASTAQKTIPEAVAHLIRLQQLRDLLLTFGGEEACLPLFEADLDLLRAHGEIWLPIGLTLKRGADCGCHANAAQLWQGSQGKIQIATGYYLTDDGMWRPHSWGIHPGEGGGRVVETTNAALLYFGVIRSPSEAQLQTAGFP